MSDGPDEPVDPVERRNSEDERQEVEWVDLDLDLDRQQERLERLAHTDPIGVVWLADNDACVNRRIGE
jgi:hypothetical protein